MTLNVTLTRAAYSGNGSAKVFAFPFPVLERDHLRVFTGPIGGALVLEDLSTWSVAGLSNPNGGSITWPVLGPALGVTGRIVIQRDVPFIQRTNYVNQSAFYPEIIEGNLDWLTMLTQQLATRDDDLEARIIANETRLAAAELRIAAAEAAANLAIALVNAIQSVGGVTIPGLSGLLFFLPTEPPPQGGLWNNGGVLCIA